MSLLSLAAACEVDTVTPPTESTPSSSGRSPEILVEGQHHNTATEARTIRARQQLSCTECHRRKQSCNRETPCQRCIARGIESQCRVATKGENKVHGRTRKAAGGDPSPRPRKSAQPPINGFSSQGQLTSTGNGNSYTFMGSGTVVDILDKSMSGPDNTSTSTAFAASGSGIVYKPIQRVSPNAQRYKDVSATLKSLISQFPERIVCDRLIDEFYKLTFMHWLFSSSHRPSFDRLYRAMWQHAPPGPYTTGLTPQPQLSPETHNPPGDAANTEHVTISFVACTLGMLCISLAFLMDDLAYLTGGNTAQLKERLFLLSRHAMVQSELEEPPDRYTVEAIFMSGVYAKMEGDATAIFLHVGSAVRIAQSLGMHRATNPSWAHISPLEDELRKRTWSALYSYDRNIALSYGRPYIICDYHCDVPLPSNCDEVDLLETGPQNVKPDHVVTDMTFSRVQNQLAKHIGLVFDTCFSVKTPTYAQVLELDAALHKFELELPSEFRNAPTELLARRPYLSMQYGMLVVTLNRVREALHRPYLLLDVPEGQVDHYAQSKIAAVTLARRSLAALREIKEFLHPKFFFFPHCAFEAAATLAVAAICASRKNTVESKLEVQRLDETIKECIVLLDSLIKVNPLASGCSKALLHLRKKYLPTDAQDDLDVATLHVPAFPGVDVRSDPAFNQSELFQAIQNNVATADNNDVSFPSFSQSDLFPQTLSSWSEPVPAVDADATTTEPLQPQWFEQDELSAAANLASNLAWISFSQALSAGDPIDATMADFFQNGAPSAT